MYFYSLGKTNDEPEYNAALVESNGRIYCAIPVDHDATHPIENILKKKPNLPVQKDAKIVQYKPWDKQAKCIDKIALILMPLLFLMVSAIYWSTYLYIGYVHDTLKIYLILFGVIFSNIISIINREIFIANFRQGYPSKYKPPNATLTSNDIRNLITSSF